MNKSIIAIVISATLVTSSVLAACGQPAAQPAAMIAPPATTEVAAKVVVAVGPTDVERLEEMQRSIQMLICQSLENGVVVSDAVNDQTQAIEKARQELLALDGQRSGTHMLIGQYIMSGQEAPDYQYELAESIEHARQEILKRVGLAD